MCKRPKFQFPLRILFPGASLCLHAHLRDCDMLGGLFYLALNSEGVRICPSYQSPAPAGTTWLSSQTRATASNFPTHLIWKPAKIGERPYKYVKQEVQITQWCKFPVIDALLKTIKILEKLQCWWMCFPPDADWLVPCGVWLMYCTFRADFILDFYHFLEARGRHSGRNQKTLCHSHFVCGQHGRILSVSIRRGF